MFKSIVIGFDGSAHASRALELAAALAVTDRIPLGILYVAEPGHMSVPAEMREFGKVEHIIDPQPRVRFEMDKAPSTLLTSMTRAAEDAERALFQFADYLIGEAEAIVRESGVTQFESKVTTGNPATEIVDYARAREADLIVVGCRGFGRFKGLMLGSTSQRVAQLADCSCLTVK